MDAIENNPTFVHIKLLIKHLYDITQLDVIDRFMLIQSVDKIKPDYFSNEAHVIISKILLQQFITKAVIPDEFIIANELRSSLKLS